MTDWIKAANPTAPITNESEALSAARSSAIAIFIGFVTGVISLIWQITHPQNLDAALAQAGVTDPQAVSVAAASAQAGLWFLGAMTVLQLVLGFIQWRNPNKIIAIVFMGFLIVFGILATAVTPLLAGMAPTAPEVSAWQIALSLVIFVVQLILLIAGFRGIKKLDRLQMDAAR